MVICFDSVYGAVLNSFRHYAGMVGADVRQVKLPFPIRIESADAEKLIIDTFRTALDECQTPIR